MLKKALIATLSASILFTHSLIAFNANAELTAAEQNAVKAQISQKLGLNVTQVQESPMVGLLELITEAGLFYSDKDASFFIQGKLYGLSDDVINHSEITLAEMRIDGMAKFAKDMIVYPAKDEKHVITVFTDITCTYCRKMHQQMSDYNDLGITVRYLAYPREGINNRTGQLTKGYKDLRSVWCNEDPNDALTRAKDGITVAYRVCDKPIEDEFNFGRQVGVTGTPAIMLDNGSMLSGYRPAKDLKALLDSM